MKKKMLFVYPNQAWQKKDIATMWILNPATLCSLATMVKDFVDVKIIDANFYKMSKQEFGAEVEAFNPDYVGISVLTSEYGKTLDITADLVKNVREDIVVIAGGVHAIVEHREIIKNENIDFVVRGEGEYVLRDLVRYLNGNGDLPGEGLVYRKDDSVVIQALALVQDLDSLPWPDYSLVKLEDYLSVEHRKGPLGAPELPFYRMTVTRGCPYDCCFCQVRSISGHKIRSRSPEQVVDHLLYMKNEYNIKSLVIDDDNMLGKKDFFKKFLEMMIEKRLDLPFVMGGVAVFLLTDELLDLMVKAKCIGINIAIESGNERVKNLIVKKPIDLDKIPEMISKIKERGIFCLGNFMIGLPGESWDEILETIKYAEDCGVDYAKIFVAIPLKNTRLWDIAVAENAFVREMSEIEVDTRFGQLQSEDWTPKDVSILRAYEWDRINFGTAEKRKKMAEIWQLSEEELRKVRRETRDAITFSW